MKRILLVLVLFITVVLFGIQTVSAANVASFTQCANGANGDQPCDWTGSILNSNAQYREGMSVPQRLVINQIDSDGIEFLRVDVRHAAVQTNVHGYDFLTAWDQDNNAALEGLNPCLFPFGSQRNTLTQPCNEIHSSGYEVAVVLPGDPHIYLRDGVQEPTQQRIDAFETQYGQRTITLRGNQPIFDVEVSLRNTLPTLTEVDTNEVIYSISWRSTSDIIIIEYAGHLAVSGRGSIAWGDGRGASNIGGGSYHHMLGNFYYSDTKVSFGTGSNQIQSGAIVGFPPEPPPPEPPPEGPPWTCEIELFPDGRISRLPMIVRDFSQAHPDFQNNIFRWDAAIVDSRLGLDRLPVYAGGSEGTTTTSSAENFNQWFRDVEGVNTPINLMLEYNGFSDQQFYSFNQEFFPIDDQGFGNEGFSRNFHFTTESRFFFEYQGGESIYLTTDDDAFVFINGELAINLGGVLSDPRTGTIILSDANAGQFGLVPGGQYEVAIFSAERNTDTSYFKLIMDGFIVLENVCEPPVPEPSALLPLPLAACGATGNLYVYESDTVRASESASFTPSDTQLLAFSRLSSGPSLQASGVPVSTSLAGGISDAYVHQASVTAGQELIVQAIPNMRYLLDYQGFVSQNPTDPLINPESITWEAQEAQTYSVYFTAQTYSIPLFDVYSETLAGLPDESEIIVRIDRDDDSLVRTLITSSPVPTGVQGVVLLEFTIPEDGWYSVTIDTEDPLYHFGFGCEPPSRDTPACSSITPAYLLTPYSAVNFPMSEVFNLQGENLADFSISTTQPWLTVDVLSETVTAAADILGPITEYITLTYKDESTPRQCPVNFYGMTSACENPFCAICTTTQCFEDNNCIDGRVIVPSQGTTAPLSRFVSLPLGTSYGVSALSVPDYYSRFSGGTFLFIPDETVSPEEVRVGFFILSVPGYGGSLRVCPELTYRAFTYTPGIGDQDSDLLVTGSRAVMHYFELLGEIITVGPFMFTAKVWVR